MKTFFDMDRGVKSGLDDTQIRDAIGAALNEPLAGDAAALADAIAASRDVLYLTDNAGEIVFDRLLIEQMPRGKVTVAVKGGPVITRDIGCPEGRMVLRPSPACTTIDAEGEGP